MKYRSRLVAKEFKDHHAGGLFAPTPPLEALRMLVSDVATVEDGKPSEEKVLMICDVARAFFEAPVKRDMCIVLPKEDYNEYDKEKDLIGKLVQSLYGTRDAAANFQEEVAKFMPKLWCSRAFIIPAQTSTGGGG